MHNAQEKSVSGHIVDLEKKQIFPGTITVENGKIVSIFPKKDVPNQYLMPGFIDAHIHIESSMLIPSEFARLAVPHGTVATVSDPHEIGNVLGVDGVRYMIENGKQVPFHFYFGVPSCVPATSFETAGATITAEDIRVLFTKDKLKYLSEMMNYPGVLARDPLVMNKIQIAKELGLPIDGHAPGLRGDNAHRYFSTGISTDHECYMLEEALDKVKRGVKILIREGSAAKNYEALHPLIKSYPDSVMFCSDDKHPHELMRGHINEIVIRSIVTHGYDLMDVLRSACYHPVKHYNLDVGLLQVGDSADFIVVSDLRNFQVKQTYIKGQLVAENGKSLIRSIKSHVVNKFHAVPQKSRHFAFSAKSENIRVIQAFDGELVTKSLQMKAKIVANQWVSDPERDILKIVVINRYNDAPPAVAFIKGFGLKHGAIGSCIAHDSHNVIAVGVSDEEICAAVNAIVENKGGISVTSNGKTEALPLPIAGIMSHEEGYAIAEKYAMLDSQAKKLGSFLQAPFMTLSFMALLVIPSLKISDKGLFDGALTDVTCD